MLRQHYIMAGTSGFSSVEIVVDDYANGTDYYECWCKCDGAGAAVIGNAQYGSFFQGHTTGGMQGETGPAGPAGGTRILLADVDITLAQITPIGPLTSDYDTYEIDGFIPPVGGAGYFRVSTNNAASFDAGNNYYQWGVQSYTTTGIATWFAQATQFYVNPGGGSSFASFNMTIRRPWSTTLGQARFFEWQSSAFGATAHQKFLFTGEYLAGASLPITHVGLVNSGVAAGFAAGGFCRLYGKK
jgi:hypothetical protein